MPTTFNPSHDSSHIASFLNENSNIITHPSMLQHAEFLSRPWGTSPHKSHSSLILYHTDAQAAANCIMCHVAHWGHLLPTVKFTRQPPQCDNCYRFGHFAQACTTAAVCGQCAGAHSSRDCKCPSNDECKAPAPCQHIQMNVQPAWAHTLHHSATACAESSARPSNVLACRPQPYLHDIKSLEHICKPNIISSAYYERVSDYYRAPWEY